MEREALKLALDDIVKIPTLTAGLLVKLIDVEAIINEALAQPEEEKLHPVHIGVDVTKEGTAVTAFYRKPDAVMEMFYSQFHPLAQPAQEPVVQPAPGYCKNCKDYTIEEPLYAQREWVGLTDEEIDEGNKQSWVSKQAWQSAVWWASEKLKEKNNGT